MDENNAAENLLGLTLKTGWVVIEKLDILPEHTGQYYSVCYKVKKDNIICFLKAYNIAKFFKRSKEGEPPQSIMDVMRTVSKAFTFERDLSLLCREKNVTKVVYVIDSGEEIVENFQFDTVPYLIFDWADGDIRKELRFVEENDFIWKIKSLHSVAVGLKQLHAIEVSHQDLKPSNVLVFKEESKIGDLGCSACQSLDSPYKDDAYAGDDNYAPPEILYQYYEKDWKKRSFATDCYLFGSLLVFYFAGISMSALLRKHLDDKVSWENYRGQFDEVRTYLLSAFAESLDEFDKSIPNYALKSNLRVMVEYLCHPFPEKRGHPKNLGNQFNQYDFQRIISDLDVLHKKTEILLKQQA